MSERKVLSKYYPPDFDPSQITRNKGPKPVDSKLPTVRLMAPFGMKCTTCGEYIYKGRKFNARKETTGEKYYSIAVFRFYIRCTRCSAEITFKTDPKNMDYECERGAKRNFEPWRATDGNKNETEEERLDRLEAEEAEMDAMGELEGKMVDAKREMQIADALDEIRTRNARLERTAKEGDGELDILGGPTKQEIEDEEKKKVEKEIEELAKKAFTTADGEKVRRIGDDVDEAEEEKKKDSIAMPPPSFKRGLKRKKDFGAVLGIKKKPALV
jgi:DNA-directed RNA polymerase subunit RPC12/RpoP